MPLTELAIKNLKPKEKPYRISDSGNLSLEVATSGSKLWRWRYYFLGKNQIISLGEYPAISLAAARKLRDEARELVKSGKHPARERKARKLQQAYEGAITFEKIAREWHRSKSISLNAKYSKQTLSRMEQYIFPAIGALPIKEITIPDVVRAIDRISDKGVIDIAKRMKQTVAQVFRYATKRGLCEHNPASDLKDILPTVEVKHHSCISVSELPKLLNAIATNHDNGLISYAIQLIALTVLRTKELIGGKWSEINWDTKEWLIPKERMKMKRPHTVPLSKQAIRILKALFVQTGNKEFIFYSSTSKSKHLSNGAILMALRRMGFRNRMTGHGFRTLASTILNEKGYAPDIIEKQLAHEDQDKVRSAYNRAEYMNERMKMMQDYADILNAMTKNNSKVRHKVL